MSPIVYFEEFVELYLYQWKSVSISVRSVSLVLVRSQVALSIMYNAR